MKRPVLITIVGIIGIIGGAAQALFGAIVVGLRNDAQFLADTKLESGTATAIGIVCVIVGILTVIFAIGLLKGSRIARALLGVSELAQLGMGIYALAALDSSRRASAIGSIVSALIVLYFVFGTDKAKAFFAKS